LGLPQKTGHLAPVEAFLARLSLRQQLKTPRIEFALKLSKEFQRVCGKNLRMFGSQRSPKLEPGGQFGFVHL
jgi:hypothetical protein